jgi:hypothetical protein
MIGREIFSSMSAGEDEENDRAGVKFINISLGNPEKSTILFKESFRINSLGHDIKQPRR